MKEFEEVELTQIKVLGDLDVIKEIELRNGNSRKIEEQIHVREKALEELLNQSPRIGTMNSSFESFNDSFGA